MLEASLHAGAVEPAKAFGVRREKQQENTRVPVREIKEIQYSQKILLVDDDPDLLEMIRDLAEERFDLTTATNAKEGLEVLERRGPFAVVLSDLHMPGMDGVTFLSRVRELSPHTVRIIITAFADIEAALEAINASHIYRFLTKPLHAQDILEVMADGLKQHRLLVADQANLLQREKTVAHRPHAASPAGHDPRRERRGGAGEPRLV